MNFSDFEANRPTTTDRFSGQCRKDVNWRHSAQFPLGIERLFSVTQAFFELSCRTRQVDFKLI